MAAVYPSVQKHIRVFLARTVVRLAQCTPEACQPSRGGVDSRPLSTLHTDTGLGGAHYLI